MPDKKDLDHDISHVNAIFCKSCNHHTTYPADPFPLILAHRLLGGGVSGAIGECSARG